MCMLVLNFDMCRAAMKCIKKKDRRPHPVNLEEYESQRWFDGVFYQAEERQLSKLHKKYVSAKFVIV